MFLRRFLDLGKKATLLHLFASCTNLQTGAAQNGKKTTPSPFKDHSLRELAGMKLHHDSDRFINPFNDKEYGNMLRVLHWKLFGENKFKSYYQQERVVPVSIDWEPIRDHSSLSVTFLKHSSILIKDQGRFILVDPVFF